MDRMELPSLLEEAVGFCEGDRRLEKLVEVVLDFEKGYSFSYKQEVKELLEDCLGEER